MFKKSTKTALIAVAMILAACGAKQEEHAGADAGASAPEEEFHAPPTVAPSAKALEGARDRVKALTLDGMLKQEKDVERGYSKGDVQGLTAASERLMQGAPDAPNWKGSEFDPYLTCDTAWRDLGLYASAMAKDLKYGGESMRKILGQEREDYHRTKKQCQDFLAMSAEEAWKAEEAKFAK